MTQWVSVVNASIVKLFGTSDALHKIIIMCGGLRPEIILENFVN